MSKGKACILYAEDEVIVNHKMTGMLRSHGYEVQMALTGGEAFQQYKEQNFDLLITDLKMPVMDGIELIREVRCINPSQRIIVATAFPAQLMPWNLRLSPSQSMEEKFDLGTIDYLIKPFPARNLLAAVAKSLRPVEGAETGSPCPDDITGTSLKLTCRDLIIMHVLKGDSIILGVRNDNDVGFIHLHTGEVVHAQTINHEGEKAFFEILSWNANDIKIKPYKEDVAHTIERNLSCLLFGEDRTHDEAL